MKQDKISNSSDRLLNAFLQPFYFLSDLALTNVHFPCSFSKGWSLFPPSAFYFLKRIIRSINASDAFFVTSWERSQIPSCQEESAGRAVSHSATCMTAGEGKVGAVWSAVNS